MNKMDIIKSYYEPNLSKDLPDYKILGWESNEAQKLRFDILTSQVNLHNKKVLDVGCGLGNLFEYLTDREIYVDYTGVDILEKMIERANKKKLDAKFYYADIFRNHPFENESFDVIYASGIFNLDLGNNRRFMSNALCKLLELTKSNLTFNLLHHHSPDKEDTYFYTSPEETVKIIEKLPFKIKKIEIIEQYLKNDFTVILEKHRE